MSHEHSCLPLWLRSGSAEPVSGSSDLPDTKQSCLPDVGKKIPWQVYIRHIHRQLRSKGFPKGFLRSKIFCWLLNQEPACNTVTIRHSSHTLFSEVTWGLVWAATSPALQDHYGPLDHWTLAKETSVLSPVDSWGTEVVHFEGNFTHPKQKYIRNIISCIQFSQPPQMYANLIS